MVLSLTRGGTPLFRVEGVPVPYHSPGAAVRIRLGWIAAVAGIMVAAVAAGVALAWLVYQESLPFVSTWFALAFLLVRQCRRTAYWRGSASWWRRHAGALLDDREDRERA